jgi:type IV pilus assembly protein PilY1
MVGESDIAALTGKACPADDDLVCGQNLAEYMKNTDLLPVGLPGDQEATLHTIGLDINSNYLESLAEKGGGNYYVANNADALLEAFNNIVSVAVSKPQTFAAPSVAASAYNRLQSGGNLFYSMFIPELSTRWAGNVKHYKFSATDVDIVGQNSKAAFENGNVSKEAQSFWSNPTTFDGDKVDSGGFGERVTSAGYLSRNMYTYVGAGNPTNENIVNPAAAFLSNNSAVLSMPEWSSSLSNAQKKELVDWTRGKDLDDSDGDGDLTDTRWWRPSSFAAIVYYV